MKYVTGLINLIFSLVISSIIIYSWKDSYSDKDMINHRFNQKLCVNCLLGLKHDEKLDKLHEEVKKINK